MTPPRAVDCRNYACSCRLYFSFFIRVLFCSFSALRFFLFCSYGLPACTLIFEFSLSHCSGSLLSLVAYTHTHTHTTGHAYYATQSELSSYRSGLVFFSSRSNQRVLLLPSGRGATLLPLAMWVRR